MKTHRPWRVFISAVLTVMVIIGSFLVFLQVRSTEVDPTSARQVAQSVLTDACDRNFVGAAQWASPSERRVVLRMATKSTPKLRCGNNLRIGSVSFSGNLAYVVLVGTLCGPTIPLANPVAKKIPYCMTNSNPKGASYFFTLKLARDRHHDWHTVAQIIR
jgi:hypothetical protein